MKAAIFDLFGTVVPNLDPSKLNEAVLAMAQALAVAPERFAEAWGRTFHHRMDGRIQDDQYQFRDVLAAIDETATERQLRAASDIRRQFMLAALTPKPHAIECLEELKSSGYRIGMATDCSSETPDLLQLTDLGPYFEVIAASARLRVTKPNAVMYEYVLNGLGVAGNDCLYVGDGNSEELIGARRHGMTTVWVDNGDQQHWHERFAPDGDHEIRSLHELANVVAVVRASRDRGGTP